MTTPAPADDDDDWSGFSKAMREAGQQRRASNRENSAALLQAEGIAFVSKNAGAHLIVTANGQTYDFWPGTGLWQVRGSTQKPRGVHRLIKHIKGASHEHRPG